MKTVIVNHNQAISDYHLPSVKQAGFEVSQVFGSGGHTCCETERTWSNSTDCQVCIIHACFTKKAYNIKQAIDNGARHIITKPPVASSRSDLREVLRIAEKEDVDLFMLSPLSVSQKMKSIAIEDGFELEAYVPREAIYACDDHRLGMFSILASSVHFFLSQAPGAVKNQEIIEDTSIAMKFAHPYASVSLRLGSFGYLCKSIHGPTIFPDIPLQEFYKNAYQHIQARKVVEYDRLFDQSDRLLQLI